MQTSNKDSLGVQVAAICAHIKSKMPLSRISRGHSQVNENDTLIIDIAVRFGLISTDKQSPPLSYANINRQILKYNRLPHKLEIILMYIYSIHQIQVMGNKWGVIHNQYDEEIIYTLHSNQMCPLEKAINKIANKTIEETVDAKAEVGYESVVKQEALKNDGVYTLPAGRIGTAGLNRLDFDVVKFLTIVTVSGKYVIKSGKVGCEQDLRIVIRAKDHSIRNLNKNQAQLLKQFATGPTILNGVCGKCQKRQTAYLNTIQDYRRCVHCSKKTKQLWICRERPNFHVFCFDCNESLQYGKQMKEDKLFLCN